MPKKQQKFIDFILEAQNNPGLLAEFMATKNINELKDFFIDEGYQTIAGDPDELEKIFKAKKIQGQMSADGRVMY